MPRFASRTDGPHRAIVDALRRVGCAVADTSRAGSGFPDLVVRIPPREEAAMRALGIQWRMGTVVLMEVKRPGGKLNAQQEDFRARFPETLVVASVEEALKAVGIP